MKIEIKSRFSGEILFSVETDSWKLAMEAAFKSGANLRYANLGSANLSSANLSYADLGSADLRYANLSYANLGSANLRSANLSYADLGSADLRYANLGSANLRYANLRYANLSYANLGSANLSYANLSSANLSYANLSSANLGSADLRYAKGIERFPISISGHQHSLYTLQDGRLAIGCHVLTLEEWEEKAEAIGKENDYSALDIEIYKLHIAHIAKVARLLWAEKYPAPESAKEVSA